MKKFVSVALALAVSASRFTNVFAAPMKDMATGVNNPVEMQLSGETLARKTGDGEYVSTLALDEVSGDVLAAGLTFDYKSTLNMQPVKDMVALSARMFGGADDFSTGKVSSNISIKVTYPEKAVISNNAVGVLDDKSNNIYIGSTPVVSGNTVTFNYTNKSLTVSDIIADNYFDDVVFTLDNSVAYKEEGTFAVKVELKGTTEILFSESTANEYKQTIKYTSSSNNTISIKKAQGLQDDDGDTGSIGGGTSSVVKYTVQFKTNGGTAVKNVSVERGNKITAPDTTKEGYVLEGWYTDSALTKKFDFANPINYNMTLYAKWEEKGTTDVPEPGEDDYPSAQFTDVKADDWYRLDVDYVVKNKLMNGVEEDKFAPNAPLTRAMLVTILYRNEGEPATNKSIPFNDIDMGDYYASAVLWAHQNGIVNGITENEFAPDNQVTREQIATIIYRYAKLKGYDVSAYENTDISAYTDAGNVSEYAVSAIKYAVGTGLMKGKTETTLNVKENVTRAEISAILHRFFEAHTPADAE